MSKKNTQCKESKKCLLKESFKDLFHYKSEKKLINYEQLHLVNHKELLGLVDWKQLHLIHVPTLKYFFEYVGVLIVYLFVLSGFGFMFMTGGSPTDYKANSQMIVNNYIDPAIYDFSDDYGYGNSVAINTVQNDNFDYDFNDEERLSNYIANADVEVEKDMLRDTKDGFIGLVVVSNKKSDDEDLSNRIDNEQLATVPNSDFVVVSEKDVATKKNVQELAVNNEQAAVLGTYSVRSIKDMFNTEAQASAPLDNADVSKCSFKVGNSYYPSESEISMQTLKDNSYTICASFNDSVTYADWNYVGLNGSESLVRSFGGTDCYDFSDYESDFKPGDHIVISSFDVETQEVGTCSLSFVK